MGLSHLNVTDSPTESPFQFGLHIKDKTLFLTNRKQLGQISQSPGASELAS